MKVPHELLDKLKQVKQQQVSKAEKREKYDRINIEFFAPFITELKKSGLCAGCHIMSVHYVEITPKLLAEAKIERPAQKPSPLTVAQSS